MKIRFEYLVIFNYLLFTYCQKKIMGLFLLAILILIACDQYIYIYIFLPAAPFKFDSPSPDDIVFSGKKASNVTQKGPYFAKKLSIPGR